MHSRLGRNSRTLAIALTCAIVATGGAACAKKRPPVTLEQLKGDIAVRDRAAVAVCESEAPSGAQLSSLESSFVDLKKKYGQPFRFKDDGVEVEVKEITDAVRASIDRSLELLQQLKGSTPGRPEFVEAHVQLCGHLRQRSVFEGQREREARTSEELSIESSNPALTGSRDLTVPISDSATSTTRSNSNELDATSQIRNSQARNGLTNYLGQRKLRCLAGPESIARQLSTPEGLQRARMELVSTRQESVRVREAITRGVLTVKDDQAKAIDDREFNLRLTRLLIQESDLIERFEKSGSQGSESMSTLRAIEAYCASSDAVIERAVTELAAHEARSVRADQE